MTRPSSTSSFLHSGGFNSGGFNSGGFRRLQQQRKRSDSSTGSNGTAQLIKMAVMALQSMAPKRKLFNCSSLVFVVVVVLLQ